MAPGIQKGKTSATSHHPGAGEGQDCQGQGCLQQATCSGTVSPAGGSSGAELLGGTKSSPEASEDFLEGVKASRDLQGAEGTGERSGGVGEEGRLGDVFAEAPS